LSKSQLIDLVISLEQRLDKIEHYLKAFDNAHTPSSKQLKKNTKPKEGDNVKPRFPGKPKGGNGGGINLPVADEVVEHKLDKDPSSGKPLGAPVGYRVKKIIDFPDKPIKVVEHRIMQYVSPTTGEIIEPEVTLPKGIYGRNFRSIVVLLKEMTNSNAKIAGFLQELGAPSFSATTAQNIAYYFMLDLKTERQKILASIRKAKYLHADETGFRKDGLGGYVWGVFTKTKAVFLASMSRARTNIQQLLGKYNNVVVVDGYNAYDIYKHKQRCWAHLIREFKSSAEDNNEITVQYVRLKNLYEKLKILNNKPPNETEIRNVKWELQDIVTCLETIKGTNKIVTLIKNGDVDWFTALYHKNVPLENNHAERELRPIVLLRKTIGCYRNNKGKMWIDIVLSVIHTWRLQKKNLFQSLNAHQH
jgi:hypothetical protein